MTNQAKPLHELGALRVTCECCIRFQDKVLMQKRSESSQTFPGYWSFPGGHIDEGEDSLKATIREVFEESGIKISPSETQLKVNALNHHTDRNRVWVVFGFLANINKFQEPVSSDEGECKWFTLSELKILDNIFPPIKYYFDHILENKPGILFMAGEWENSELKKLRSESISR